MTDDQALAIIRARRGTLYDPTVVDTFERVCRDIGPMAVKPQMQKAIQQINRAASDAGPAPAPRSRGAERGAADGPDSLAALANLARIVSGRPDRDRRRVDDLGARAPRRAGRELRVLPERCPARDAVARAIRRRRGLDRRCRGSKSSSAIG